MNRCARSRHQLVALPATDLYLGGRKDRRSAARADAGQGAVHRRRQRGLFVEQCPQRLCAVRRGRHASGRQHACARGAVRVPEHQLAVLEMGTYNAARAIGLEKRYGIAVGRQADLVILDTSRVADALLDIPPRLWVVKRGRVTVVTEHRCQIHGRSQRHASPALDAPPPRGDHHEEAACRSRRVAARHHHTS
ncbi:amidohydrolase family protein [Cupriavidus basilensis]